MGVFAACSGGGDDEHATPSALVDGDALTLFWGDGCPHCERERAFLEDLIKEFPSLDIVEYEVWHDEDNRTLFEATVRAQGEDFRGSVPTTLFGGRMWVGYNEGIGTEIRSVVAAAMAAGGDASDGSDDAPDAEPDDVVDVPLVGDVAVGTDSLLVSTLAIGFVDGFNPCSLWVLSMLLALVLHTRSRRRVLAVGVVFLVVTTAMYGLYIAGAYKVLDYVSYVTWIRIAVALLALTFGLINLKDFIWFGRGPSLMIAETKKAGLLAKMRRAADADRPLPEVLGGTAALAVGVSLIETPCTAGFPILWADLVAESGVEFGVAAALFAVYMAVFLIDELAVLGAAVVAMRVTKLQERHGRVLKLVGGMVMVTLAGVLMLAPHLMESVGGAIVVFAAAASLSLGVLAIDRARTKRTPTRPRATRPGRRRPRSA